MLSFLVIDDLCTNDHRNTSDARPVLHISDQVQVLRVGCAPTFTHFNATVPFVENY